MLRRAIFGWFALALIALAPARAEDPPAAPAVAKALQSALRGPARERLLTPRWFEDETGGVVRCAGEALEDGGLRLSLTFLPVAAMREERTRLVCEVGPDGLVRAVENELVRGEERLHNRGRIAEGELRLETGEGQVTTAAWGPDVLPLPLLVCALPALCDQGLPERLQARLFHGFSERPEKKLATISWSAADGAWRVQATALAEGQAGTLLVVEEGTARPREVVLAGLRLTPISAEEAQRRLTPAPAPR